MAGVAALLVLLVAAAPVASATDYTVGDSQGWASGVDYTTWASGKTFTAGDTLLFQYSALHNVEEVGEADYKACSTSNSIQTYTDQSTKITLAKPGNRYFICGTPGHCSGGMKLAVTVAGSSSSTPSSPPSTTSESTPPTSSPSNEPSSDTPSSTKSPANNSGGRSSGFHSGNALLFGVLLLLGLGLVG